MYTVPVSQLVHIHDGDACEIRRLHTGPSQGNRVAIPYPYRLYTVGEPISVAYHG